MRFQKLLVQQWFEPCYTIHGGHNYCSNSPFSWNNPLHQSQCDTIIRWISVAQSLLKSSLALAPALPSSDHLGPNNQFYQSPSPAQIRLGICRGDSGLYSTPTFQTRLSRGAAGCWRRNNMNKIFPSPRITLKPFQCSISYLIS